MNASRFFAHHKQRLMWMFTETIIGISRSLQYVTFQLRLQQRLWKRFRTRNAARFLAHINSRVLFASYLLAYGPRRTKAIYPKHVIKRRSSVYELGSRNISQGMVDSVNFVEFCVEVKAGFCCSCWRRSRTFFSLLHRVRTPRFRETERKYTLWVANPISVTVSQLFQ